MASILVIIGSVFGAKTPINIRFSGGWSLILVFWYNFSLKFKALITKHHLFFTEIITKNLIATPQIMFSRAFTLLELNASTSQASADRFRSTLPFTFGRIIQPSRLAATVIVHDWCKRPKPIYNYKYNYYTLLLCDIDAIYFLYVYRKFLYNDRAAIVANLP
jgi:hypothetical protein